MPLEVAVRDACSTIGEGPHWDEASQTLYYVDIEDKSVSRWNSASGGVQKIKLGNDYYVNVFNMVHISIEFNA